MSIGRNDPCFCKSGKKYKKCCMLKSSKERLLSTESPKVEIVPVPLKQDQYFKDRGVREFVLATINWGMSIINTQPLNNELLIKVIDDLRLFASSQNQRETYIVILKSTFRARNQPLSASQILEFNRLAYSEPGLMLNEQHLLQEIVLSSIMDLDSDFSEPDYGMIYAQLEFAFLAIRDVLLEQNKYLEHVQLIVDVKNSKEFLSNWSIEYQQVETEDLNVPEPVLIGISHLNEGYNTLQKVKNEYHLLEEQTKKNISTALYYTEHLSDEIQQYLSYDGIILSLITSVEKELRIIMEANNKHDFRKIQFLDLINELYEKYSEYLIMYPIEGIHELRKLRNQLAHAESSTTRADFLLTKNKLIDSNFFKQIQQIKIELNEAII